MREDFLHYVWRLAQFNHSELQTTAQLPIEIYRLGIHNHHSGPDFTAAWIKIGDIEWVGQVEIHLRSSDWYAHRHHTDPAYDNVILHVVLEDDQTVFRSDGSTVPCLELKGRIPPKLINNYWRLMHNEHWIACQHQIASVNPLIVSHFLERISVERLNKQSDVLKEQLNQCNKNWEEVFYRSIARSLGGRVNSDAMEMLARSVPLHIIMKHRYSLIQIEALLFGQSGLLPEETGEGEYPQMLSREYQLLASKYKLKPLPKVIWRYLRLRPANFPNIRIAQLALLLSNSDHLFSNVLAANNIQELEQMFALELSNYWQEHYLFGKTVKRTKRKLGKKSVHSIIINTVVPLLSLYGQLRGNSLHQEKAIAFLQALPAEQNSIIKHWSHLNQQPKNAAESQAMLELYSHYCSRKRCMNCSIGCSILSNKNSPTPILSVNESTLLYRYGLVM